MTDQMNKSILYSSFNARALRPFEVAQTFVPPPEFFKLAVNSHTFVVGPRGSGKTTLLKMLQQPAIESWSHPLAKKLRDSVGFTGIFIPTDVTLTSQLQAATSGLKVEKALINGAYAIHVLRAFLNALEYRTGRIESGAKHKVNRIKLSDQEESEFVSELSHCLQRKPRTPSFTSLKTNLTAYLTEIYAISQRLRADESLLETDVLEESGVLRLDITRTTSMAIDAFEGVTGASSERWALLCDELELAPPSIVEELVRRVRSTDERFLFKLSLSPYVAGETELNEVLSTVEGGNSRGVALGSTAPAQENEDFDTIRLWFPSKQEGKDFGRELAQSVVKNRGIDGQSIDDMLGRSVFEAPEVTPRRSSSAYAPGSTRNERMKRLAASDSSFRDYLLEKEIDLDQEMEDDDMRAKTLRKINSIVIVREAFRKFGSARSRKNPGVYAGATAFFAICESNPRFLIGMLNQLLGDDSNISHSAIRIDASQQAAVYASATARFRAYLRTIPSPKVISGSARGLLSVIELIGKHFYEECVAGPFDDDPDCSFTVDSSASLQLTTALQIALNAGAIIWVPEKKDETLLTSVKGKRFRLSYLLAPYYQLPLHLGRSVSLGKILRSNTQEADHMQKDFLDVFDRDNES